MVKTFQREIVNGTTSVAASTTLYGGFSYKQGLTATETDQYYLTQNAGTWSFLTINILTNDRAATTVKSRIDVANGNQSISTTSTGNIQDTVNSDTITAGKKLAMQLVTGSGGTTFTYKDLSGLYNSNTGQVTHWSDVPRGQGASVTRFGVVSGRFGITTTEANAQIKARSLGTWKNLYANVTVFSGTNCTFRSRVATANGNQSVTISATGISQDTSNSDTPTNGQLINISMASGTGGVTFGHGSEYLTTDNTQQVAMGTSDAGGFTIDAAATFYYNDPNFRQATETNINLPPLISTTISNIFVYLVTNTISATSTWSFETNTATPGNQTVNITASTAGYYEDTTNSDALTTSNLYSYKGVGGATGTSARLEITGFKADNSASAVSSPSSSVSLSISLSPSASPSPSSSVSSSVSLSPSASPSPSSSVSLSPSVSVSSSISLSPSASQSPSSSVSLSISLSPSASISLSPSVSVSSSISLSPSASPSPSSSISSSVSLSPSASPSPSSSVSLSPSVSVSSSISPSPSSSPSAGSSSISPSPSSSVSSSVSSSPSSSQSPSSSVSSSISLSPSASPSPSSSVSLSISPSPSASQSPSSSVSLSPSISQSSSISSSVSLSESPSASPSSSTTDRLKYWNGSSWVLKPLKYWNGSTWIT